VEFYVIGMLAGEFLFPQSSVGIVVRFYLGLTAAYSLNSLQFCLAAFKKSEK